MSNKKTIKRNKRNSKRGKSRKGGFFGLFKDKHNTECNPNDLVNLKSSSDLHTNYEQCCPKTWYGRKNNSPYCKQVELNFKSKVEEENNAKGDYIDENDEEGLRPSDLANMTGNLYQYNAVGPSKINCKDNNVAKLLTSQDKMEEYITTCECNKSRWNPFSKKKENCGIVKKKLDDIINKPILKEERRQQEEQEEQERHEQIRQVQQKRYQEMQAAEEEDKKTKALSNQNYENITKKKREERDNFMNKYMKNYPPKLYDNYTRQQLNIYPKDIIQNNKNKKEFAEQFMIKYTPVEYGYTYEELMIDPNKVEREVKEKEPQIEYARYQENLDPYDIDKDTSFKTGYNKIVDPFGEDDLNGGSKRTKKHFIKRSIGKHSIRKIKQKRRKTRKH